MRERGESGKGVGIYRETFSQGVWQKDLVGEVFCPS